MKNNNNIVFSSSILEVLIAIVIGVMIGLALSQPLIKQYKQLKQNTEIIIQERYEYYEFLEGQTDK